MIQENTNKLNKLQINSVHDLLDIVAERQRSDFGNIGSDIKSDGTLITDCDRWSDAEIVKGLSRITKDSGILSEEGSKIVPNSEIVFV